jgi:NAD(P)-dependent dehydrogenase (short-subunit alcohol dehydrogenase family)
MGTYPELFPKFQLPAKRKLTGKVAIITGGDSNLGRATAMSFAAHGANIVVLYWKEEEEVFKTAKQIERLLGTTCLTIRCNVTKEDNCIQAVKTIVRKYDQIDVLVNNAATSFKYESIEDITNTQIEEIFQENVFPMFYFSKAVLPYMKKGGSIINTASETASNEIDTDYSATQEAVVSFTCSLSTSLDEIGIRVNGIVPGICIPFIPSGHEIEEVDEYGIDSGLKYLDKSRKIIPCYIYLASDDSSVITGQFFYHIGMKGIAFTKN